MLLNDAQPGTQHKSRSGLLSLLTAAVLINYLDRGALSIAAPLLSREMSLSAIQVGLLFSAFFWSYSTLQLVAGWLVDRWGVFRVFSGGFLLWSIATAITPFVGGFGGLFCARLVLGAGESVGYPVYSSILVDNFPEEKRGSANALLDAASKMGPVLSTAVGALTVQRFGWRPLFYGLAGLSFVWFLPWISWQRRRVDRHVRQVHQRVSFIDIAMRRELWITSAGMFALGYVWSFLLSWLPMYLVNQLGFALHQVALLGSLPFVAMATATLAGGWLSDRWIASGASVSRVRKTFVNTGLILCSVAIVPVPYCKQGMAITLLTISCAFLGLFTSNVWAITQTLAGVPASGSWSGIQNAIGNLGGIASASVTGIVVYWTGSYVLAFLSCSAILLGGVIAYCFLGPIKPLHWKNDQTVGTHS